MRQLHFVAATAAAVLLVTSVSWAAQISGEYLEARSCDVWTGPCFANAEMDLAGKEAVMAWKVDKGSWNGVALDGLGVALVLNAEWTLGETDVFPMKPGKIKSVVLVDSKASAQQRDALLAFVKESVGKLMGKTCEIRPVPMTLENDHLEGRGVFKAGDVAEIETRAFKENDCICTNEIVFYRPLAPVENSSAVFSKKHSYQGDGLNHKWTIKHQRSGFQATFRR